MTLTSRETRVGMARHGRFGPGDVGGPDGRRGDRMGWDGPWSTLGEVGRAGQVTRWATLR